ncbi:hypothetical protein P167DRAFT_359024 [Morchella conica CCBAS932]|uniref:Secreted protein n=1 Tax=Morchella conica CCBAS932 TaxID=1392247 RepID=A0A3N4KCU1_9PEZI|nr:hypothetical protein P167DRAFT_359024 [Morchella conica CCBAS932]
MDWWMVSPSAFKVSLQLSLSTGYLLSPLPAVCFTDTVGGRRISAASRSSPSWVHLSMTVTACLPCRLPLACRCCFQSVLS